MISRVADNMTIQASEQTATEIRSDPVALGDYNLGRGVLVVHKIAAPTGNQAALTVTPEYSNDGTYWADGGSSLITANTGGDTVSLANQFEPETGYVRFLFSFNPSASGSDDGIAYITFDWVVRYSNQ